MEQAGIDPQIVANWRDYYAKQFEVEDTPTGVGAGNGGGIGGGVGAGIWYTAVK
jgi:hypothetical protein